MQIAPVLPLELPYAASFFFCAPFILHLLTQMEISYHLIYNLTSGKGGRYMILQVYSDCLPSIISLLILPVILWLLSEKFSLSHYQKGILGGILLFSDFKSGQSFANRILWRECTGHIKLPLPTTQEKTLYLDITRWSTLKSDWLYSLQPKMKKLYTVSKNKTGSWLWLRSWTPYCQIQT